jgi:serine/threonine-protein kinase
MERSRHKGERLGRYRLLSRIGEGGMAEVYQAVATGAEGFARTVVIKRILPELARRPAFVRMFVEEAKLSAMLHHPCIVQVYELGQADGEYFLAMESVEGTDLSTLLGACRDAGTAFPPGLVAYLVAEVARALAYAHALRDDSGRPLDIIHRDVSPSNIMVAATGAVKLLDFGIAKAAFGLDDERTRTGTIKGKVGYLSPEQADGGAIDRRADLFALGAVMYECLTSRRLFRGVDDFATLRLVREAAVEPPSRTHPEIPLDLEAVLLRLLAREPDRRFATGDEVVSALSSIVHRLHTDAAALREFVAERLLPALARASDNTETKEYGRREAVGTLTHQPAPRRRWRAIAATLAITAALAGTAMLVIPRIRATEPPAPSLAAAGADAVPAPAAAGADAVPAPDALVPVPDAAPAPVPSPSQGAAVRAERPTTSALIRLRIDGTVGAEVLEDRRTVGRIPLDVRVASKAGSRRLTIRRAGFADETRTVPAGHDVALTVSLQPRARPASTPAGSASPEIKDPFAP